MSLPLFPDEAPRVIDGPLPPVERVPYQPASATSREGADKAAVNIAKRHMTDDEFLTLCGEAMAWIGRRIQMVDELA